MRLFLAAAVGVIVLLMLPHGMAARARGILAWDVGTAAYLLMIAVLFATSPPERMPAHAEAQQDGEWTLFFLVLAGVTASFAAFWASSGA